MVPLSKLKEDADTILVVGYQSGCSLAFVAFDNVCSNYIDETQSIMAEMAFHFAESLPNVTQAKGETVNTLRGIARSPVSAECAAQAVLDATAFGSTAGYWKAKGVIQDLSPEHSRLAALILLEIAIRCQHSLDACR